MPRAEELRIQAGDATLAATLLVPDDPPAGGRHPNVLLLPSWLPRDRDGSYDRVAHAGWFAADARGTQHGLLRRLAESLAGRGVASLRADPRG